MTLSILLMFISGFMFVQDLSENDFEVFPKQLGYLTKLTKLTIAKNRLRALPNEFGALYSIIIYFEILNNLSVL